MAEGDFVEYMFAKKYLMPILNYLYKICLILGICMTMITISFFIDFINIKGYKFEAVKKVDCFLIFTIVFRNILWYCLKIKK